MKKQLFACMLALLSVSTHGLSANASQPRYADLLGKLGLNGKFAGMPIKYDAFRTTCLNTSWLAKNPTLHKYVQDHFDKMVVGSVILGVIASLFGMRELSRWNVRRKDNNVRENFAQMTSEERTAFVASALKQLPELLKSIPNSITVSAQMESVGGVPLSFKVPGFSTDAVHFTITGPENASKRIELRGENHLRRQQGLYTFQMPYRQSAITTGLESIGSLLSRKPKLIELIANALANLPAANYIADKDGLLNVSGYEDFSGTLLNSDAVFTLIQNFSQNGLMSVEHPFVSFAIESNNGGDDITMAVTNKVSGARPQFILNSAVSPQQAAASSAERTRQVQDNNNTQRIIPASTHLARRWNDGIKASMYFASLNTTIGQSKFKLIENRKENRWQAERLYETAL